MRQILCFGLFVCSLAFGATFEGKVVGVSDGDTVTVLDAGQTMHKIRLEGVDTPEKKQAFGSQAKSALSDLAFGKKAQVVWKKKDRYGRILGKVVVDGKDVGLEQIRAGMGWHYKQYAREQEKVDQQTYAQAELAARQSKLGLWTDPEPLAPWEFRKQKRWRKAGVANKSPSDPDAASQDNATH